MKCRKTNKDKSSEIFPPLLLKPYICARSMLEVKKGQQMVPILKKKIVLCPSWSYYSMHAEASESLVHSGVQAIVYEHVQYKHTVLYSYLVVCIPPDPWPCWRKPWGGRARPKRSSRGWIEEGTYAVEVILREMTSAMNLRPPASRESDCHDQNRRLPSCFVKDNIRLKLCTHVTYIRNICRLRCSGVIWKGKRNLKCIKIFV